MKRGYLSLLLLCFILKCCVVGNALARPLARQPEHAHQACRRQFVFDNTSHIYSNVCNNDISMTEESIPSALVSRSFRHGEKAQVRRELESVSKPLTVPEQTQANRRGFDLIEKFGNYIPYEISSCLAKKIVDSMNECSNFTTVMPCSQYSMCARETFQSLQNQYIIKHPSLGKIQVALPGECPSDNNRPLLAQQIKQCVRSGQLGPSNFLKDVDNCIHQPVIACLQAITEF